MEVGRLVCMNIVLGVSGGIAAFKSVALLRLLVKAGHDVRVVCTESALKFVGKATFEALSHHPVATEVWEDVDKVAHVHLGQDADLVIVAPATADVMAKAVQGMAPDLLTNTLLMARKPVMFVPAMHTEMWEHPATVANVQTLRERGCYVLEPAVGRLTGPDSGAGRFPEPEQIFQNVEAFLRAKHVGRTACADLAGHHVVVSAGGTREALDPVRYLTNRSSGKQGYAIAAAAAAHGAEVTLVTSSPLAAPAGVTVEHVESAADLQTAMTKYASSADVLVMAAAVSDYRAAEASTTKLKKSGDQGLNLVLAQNPDILANLVQRRADGETSASQTIVGFAAETGDDKHTAAEYARAKLSRKGCDLLVSNDVSGGQVFGQDSNTVDILAASSLDTVSVAGSKMDVAEAVIQTVINYRNLNLT